MQQDYRICRRCIMDTSDPEIQFDEQGFCNHCRNYFRITRAHKNAARTKQQQLESLVATIKRQGQGRRYDSIIGVSGGVDSTYVAYVVKNLGLRPLAVHLDNGWNSELAVHNIQQILNTLHIDLYTHVINWDEFKDLQLSFLRASTPDAEIPTDHAITALLYHIASREGIHYIISGGNDATEGILPRAWSHGHSDWRYIQSIHRKFGKVPIKTFPHYNLFQSYYFQLIKRIEIVYVLNYMDYVKSDAMKTIERELGWRDYGGKHFESQYTKFFQGYILPIKFGFDKRRAHYATLICSGQITRDAALEAMKSLPYNPDELGAEAEFVAKKFGLTQQEFEDIMHLPVKTFTDYPSYESSRFYRSLRTGVSCGARMMRQALGFCRKALSQ